MKGINLVIVKESTLMNSYEKWFKSMEKKPIKRNKDIRERV